MSLTSPNRPLTSRARTWQRRSGRRRSSRSKLVTTTCSSRCSVPTGVQVASNAKATCCGACNAERLRWLARTTGSRDRSVSSGAAAGWLPLFQFEPNSLSLRPESQRVVAELAPYFDGWRLALWFAEPNLWLADRSPVDLLETNPTYVLDAARADRFVAAG